MAHSDIESDGRGTQLGLSTTKSGAVLNRAIAHAVSSLISYATGPDADVVRDADGGIVCDTDPGTVRGSPRSVTRTAIRASNATVSVAITQTPRADGGSRIQRDSGGRVILAAATRSAITTC